MSTQLHLLTQSCVFSEAEYYAGTATILSTPGWTNARLLGYAKGMENFYRCLYMSENEGNAVYMARLALKMHGLAMDEEIDLPDWPPHAPWAPLLEDALAVVTSSVPPPSK